VLALVQHCEVAHLRASSSSNSIPLPVQMPSLIPVDNLLGAFFIGVVLSSMCEATVVILNFLPADKMESRVDYTA